MQYRTRYTPINTADKRHTIERQKRNGRWTAVIKRPGEEKARADRHPGPDGGEA